MSSDTSSVMLIGFILAPFICKIQTSGKTLGVREIYTIKYKIYQSHVNFQLATEKQLVLGRNFIELFRSLTDAEGSFITVKNKNNAYSFNFLIELHLYYLGALKFIQSTLQLGKIVIYQSLKEVRFIVSTQREIAVII